MRSPFNRLFVDISYTRTQTGSIGVTRTVRSLLREFQQAAPLTGLQCRPIIVHSSGFREIALLGPAPLAATPPKAASGKVARMFRWITGGRARRLALGSLPLSFLHAAWRRYSLWTFDALSRHALPVAFQPGDVLFMGDASWHYEAWHAVQLARQKGCRVVLMVHDLIPLRHPEYCSPLVSMVFGKWLARMLRCVDAAICNSQATESELRDYAASVGLALPPAGHFRLGCDPVVGQPCTQSVRPEIAHFLSKPGASFAAVGSFEPRKNYAWLLQVFEGLWAKGHNMRLLIAGRATADGQDLVEKMKQHPEHGRELLTVLDASDQELEYLYAHACALLFPSLAEGFGLPLVEARTRGCLVIANDLPVFRELADAGVSLYAENSTREMADIVIEHAGRLRRPLLDPMPTFSWRDSAKQCLQVMEGLLTAQARSEEGLQHQSWPK